MMQVVGVQRLTLGPAFVQHAPAFTLDVLRLDLPAAVSAPPAALADAPVLRRLELTDVSPHMGMQPAKALAAVLAAPQLTELVFHVANVVQLRSRTGGGGWAFLLDALRQRRPSLLVSCTGSNCTLQCWPCGSCPYSLPPTLLSVKEKLQQLQRPRQPDCFDSF